MTLELDPVQFEEFVVRAVNDLPEEFAKQLVNVDIVVEDEPSDEQLQGLGGGRTLFGLYQGVPHTQRGYYNLTLPDKISIFRGPIVRASTTRDEVEATVRRTVIHEIAHHFGISDARLRELGAY